jgi:dTDP-4-dehydrorhamnose reductase
MSCNNVAVLGSKGMLGTEVCSLLSEKQIKVHSYDLPEFDITNTDQLENALAGVDTVINCAAFTDVDAAEDKAEQAMRINADAVGYIGYMAAKKKINVYHVSTDFVFDGRSASAYSENDLPNPVNTYGKTKLKGEELLEKSGCCWSIIRVQWSYGRAGSNFVSKIVNKAKTTDELKIVDDQIGAPTWTRDMAKAIIALMEKNSTGLYHFANCGFVSRFQVAKYIKNFLHLNCTFVPCKSSEFDTAAERPKNTRFDISKIQSQLSYNIPVWQDSMSVFLKKEFTSSNIYEG